jgi:hypothetical protein
MSSLRIEEKFTVAAPPARVWRFLLDPAQVASCLPGARLDGTEGERTFLGTMKVKVGPVTTEFKGKATFIEIDEAARRMRLSGTGDDKAGGGSARMTMEGRVEATAEGGSEITVTADVELAGKLVRFGRGMIEGVSKQLFKTFAERARALVASPAPDAAPSPSSEPAGAPAPPLPAAPAAPPAPVETQIAEPAPGPAQAIDLTAPPPPPAPAPAGSSTPADATAPAAALVPAAAAAPAAATAPADSSTHEDTTAPAAALVSAAATAPADASAPANASAPAAATAPAAAPVNAAASVPAAASAPAAPHAPATPAPRPASPAPVARHKDDEVLDAGALIWTVLWDRIKRFFRRLIGRG